MKIKLTLDYLQSVPFNEDDSITFTFDEKDNAISIKTDLHFPQQMSITLREMARYLDTL